MRAIASGYKDVIGGVVTKTGKYISTAGLSWLRNKMGLRFLQGVVGLLFLLAVGALQATPACGAASAAAYQKARIGPNPGWDVWELKSCAKRSDGAIWFWQCVFRYGNSPDSTWMGTGGLQYIWCPDGATPPNYLPGPNLGPTCHCAGDPINLATGNEFRREEDYGFGLLTVERYYNSDDYVAPANLGAHWRHSYDRKVVYSGGSSPSATLYQADGRQLIFMQVGTAWVPDLDISDTLQASTDASGAITGWVHFDAGKKIFETFSAQGALISYRDYANQVVTLQYSDASTPASIAPAAGLLIGVTDPGGRTLSLSYDAQSRVTAIATPDGQAIHYGYDTASNLSQVTWPSGETRTYLYGEAGLVASPLPYALTGIVDESGRRLATITYDSSGRATSSKLGDGAEYTQVTYATGAAGDSAAVTYANGVTSTFGFAAPYGTASIQSMDAPCGAACDQSSASRSLDARGHLSSTKDFNGHLTQYSYDANGLLTSRVDASGESGQRTTVTAWDSTFRVPLQRTVADANGAVVEKKAWTYNDRGQLRAACEVDPALAGGYTCAATGSVPVGVRRWTYAYCDAVDGTQCPRVGLLLSVTGPRTDLASTTHYSYYLSADESGCGTAGGACHRAGDLYQIIDALGHISTMVAYDKNGRVVRVRDANGVVTDSTYHARGWLLTRTVRANADGTPSSNDATTQFGYTPYGAVASVTDPDGVQVTYTYDAAHRLTDITDALGNRIHYTLDGAGNKTKEETFDASNTLRRSLARSYNTLGQLTGIKDGLNRTVFDASFSDSYDANGNLIRSADALGIQRKQGYDALNRLVSTLDNYNGTDTATQNTQSVFAYGPRDELQGVSDPDGLNTTYDYDGLGNATAVHSPDTGTSSFVYDAAGNRIQATDARTIVSHSTYDALNRLTATTYPTSAENISYRYDEADSVTGCVGSYPVGRLTSVVETAVTTVYCYDARGNVVTKRQSQGTNVDTVSYTYTLADRLASIGAPDGTATQYGRDGAGRINAVTVLTPGAGGAGAGNVVTNVSYLPFGPILSYTLGNGQTITRTYDANYAVTDIVSPALNLHFARDAMGNITALGNASGANPAIETYSYDPLYRLTGLKDAQGQAIEAYTYNKTGDRLSKASNGLATGAYGYQAGTHWLTSIGSSTRTYDANGNTTGSTSGGDAFGYGYNDRNRISVVQRNGQTVANYTYNAMGQRVAKVAMANQRFAYDEGSQLIGEYGASSRSYVWLDNLPVAMVDTNGTISTVSYVHADGLGTPRVVTDGSGFAVWQWAYQANPFGERAASTAGASLNLRFAGQYYDAEFGLYYNVQRHYDPAGGRYMQSDPIGFAGGVSTYVYASNKSLRYADPLGLKYAEMYAGYGAITGFTVAAGASVGVDAVTGGINIAATPFELGLGTAAGGYLGYKVGEFADWLSGNSPSGAYAKPPENAYDPNGPKAPGKPGEDEGFIDPKSGESWIPNPNPGSGGASSGWADSKGRVWCPTGQGGRAHGGPHWDVQLPGGGYINVRPGQNINDL